MTTGDFDKGGRKGFFKICGAILFQACLMAGQGAFGAACVSPPPGLIGWWRAEGNAADSVSTNNGSLQGGATATAAGMVGQTFTFDGTNGFVQVPDSPALRPANLTIECWVRFSGLDSAGAGTSPPGDQYIVFRQNSRYSDFEGFDLSKTRLGGADVFRFQVSSASAQLAELESVTPLSVGVWYHVAAVRGSNFTQIYVNGNLEAQMSVSFPQDYGNFPLFFGTSGESYWDHKLKGNLDEVSIYNRALSAAEIAGIYAAGSAGKCTSGPGLTITTQPQSQTLPVGTNATFTVAASGAGPLGYQWQLNGAPITGATTTSLTLTNIQTSDGGNYSAVVTNSTTSVTSAVAVLTVLVPPSITAQPQSATNLAGTTASFSANAAGSSPLTFRWRLNGAPLTDGGRISGAATLTLTISNAQPADAGNYTLFVTNLVGAVTSAPAALTITGPPTITASPASQTVPAGTNVTLTATATGTQPLGYQWQKGGVALSDGGNVSGATSSSLTLTSVQGSDSGNYNVVVTNIAGSATSAVAVVTVLTPPAITAQPQSATNVTGTTASFSANASGSAPLSLRWRLNGAPLSDGGRISGSATFTLTISNAQPADAGNYTLFVTNQVGAVTSAPAALTITGPPTITASPASQTVPAGTNVTLTVTATGTQPLGYQWQKGGVALSNGGNVSGATSSSLTLTAVQGSDSGNYNVVVTNIAGSATSAVAVVTVLTPPAITAQPQSTTNVTGTTASFNANASGSAPLSLRWRLNGAALSDGGRISGSATFTLTISNAQPADAGSYTLFVTNQVGAVTSAPAALTIIGPPVITGPPASQTIPSGSNVTFMVTATGTPPLAYQWRKNGINLSNGGNVLGATTPSLALTAVQTNDAGGYSVVVTNIAGATTSSVATLAVSAPGNCLASPQGLVGWWPGDGSAIDIIGGNNGTFQGGANASAVGEVAQAFAFNGTNDFVTLPDVAVLRPSIFTIEAWVKFNGLDSQGSGGSPTGDQYIIFKQNSRSSDFEGIDISKTRVTGGDVFRFQVSSAAAQLDEIHSTTFISAGVWYHIAAVRGSNFTQFYVNGHMEAQGTANFAQDYGSFPLYFGTSGESYWDHKFKGNLDEVSIYSRPLASSEIAAIYAAGSNGKCKGVIAPTILVQPSNQILVPGGVAGFTVSAAGTAPLNYQWMKDSLGLIDNGHITGSTTPQLLITNLQSSDAGNYQVVVNNSSGSVTSIVASLSTGIPPANDNFAAAVGISGSSGSISGNNANATKQPGEPNHAGNPGGVSVWYNWTAPSTSPVTFDTAMSAFDTLLAVYTGNNVNSLTPIASNDNASPNNPRSRLTFTPVSGTVYHIAVDGANGANGNFTLRWANASTPLPDLSVVGAAVAPRISTETFDPSSCAVMEGLIQAGTRRIIRFSTETENSGTASLYFGNPANNPLFVWAPCHAHYHFQNYMAYRLRNSSGQIAALGLKVGFCILDVFRWSSGAARNALYTCSNQGIQVGWGDLYDSTLDGQWIDTTGLPDGNYTIEIEANPLGIIQEANYANNITQVPITIGNPTAPPFNDNFSGAQTLLGGFTSVAGVNSYATKQAGEPNHAGNAGGHSVWYQWTAVDTKPVTIDTIGSTFDTLLGVYTGSSVSALTTVASNDDIIPGTNTASRVTFNATAGVVYNIAVDGFNGATGSIVLTLNQTIQNDNFTGCEFVGGVSGVAHGANTGATKEPGEPNHAGNPGGSSIWYCWTAPINGTATFDTIGSTFNTLLAAYTGSAVNGLTVVASNDDITPGSNLQSRITFNAVGLTMYHIAIDGYNGATGDTTLNWSLLGTGQTPALVGVFSDQTGSLLADKAAVLSYSFLPEGEFQIAISGAPQQKYRIDRSCDLAHWIPLAPTVADFDGHAWFTDKAPTHSKTASGDPVCGNGAIGLSLSPTEARFYRAVAVP
jgi:hypothetical protein